MRKFAIFGSILLMALSFILTQCSFNTEPKRIPPTTPIQTSTMAFTLTPRQTTLATITKTSLETLAQQWRSQFGKIQELVNNPTPDCQFPCWWGIIPGKTSWHIALQSLTQKRLSGSYDSLFTRVEGLNSGEKMYDVFAQESIDDNTNTLFISFFVHDNTVDLIKIDNAGSPGEEIWKSTWSAFSPETMIHKLGKPTQIKIRVECGGFKGLDPKSCPSYSLFIFYDSLGTYLHYSFFYILTNKNSLICPNYGFGGDRPWWFEVILKSPDDSTSFENYDFRYSIDHSNSVISYQEATGKSLDDFYKSFIQTDQPPCFRLLGDPFHP